MPADPDVVRSLILLGAGLVAVAFFSGTEVAFPSLSRAIRHRLAQGKRLGNLLYAYLSRNPRRLYRTTQIGSDLATVAVAAGLGAIVERAAPDLPDLVIALGTAFVVLPVLLLVGQVAPKSLAIPRAEGWVRLLAVPMAAATLVLAPVRLVGEMAARVVLWATGSRRTIRPRKDELLDEDEFRSMIDAGSKEGEIAPAEKAMIHKVLEFSDKTVASIMTPVGKVFALSYELPIARIIEEIGKSRFSRVPIYRGHGARMENVVGILLAKDLVAIARGIERPRPLQSLLFPPFYAPKTTKCDKLFAEMQRRHTGLALVVDEYGRTCGLVTMGDLLDDLFGDLERHVSIPPPGDLRKTVRDAPAILGSTGEVVLADEAVSPGPGGEPS